MSTSLPPRKVRANPGGEIAPEEVFGRDELVRAIWRALEVQSVVIVAERRMGKTTVVKKMRANLLAGMHLAYRDVEGVRTPLEFAEAVAKDVEPLLSRTAQGAHKLKKLFSHLAGAELGGVLKFPSALEPHWKSLLEATLEDLLTHDTKTTYVFVWDELPLMIDKILRSSNEPTAMDILDTLRGLRQKHSNLRMIYAGSIGLHHVLGRLQSGASLNAVINDMRTMEVGELNPVDGIELARALLAGEGLDCPPELPGTIASAVDNVPFYIHQVVGKLSEVAGKIDAQRVEDVVGGALVDPQDPWHLEHFLQRLATRYDVAHVPLARAALAILADLEAAAPVAEISKHLRSRFERMGQTPERVAAVLAGDDEPLRSVLTLLARDHYIKRDQEGRYQFRFSLLRRWWKLQEA